VAEDAPTPQSCPARRPRAAHRLLVLAVALSAAVAVGRADILSAPGDLKLFEQILDLNAPAPYTYHTWAFLQVAQLTRRLTGAELQPVCAALRLAGYLATALALVLWLGCMCGTEAGVLVGVLWALASLSWMLRQHGWAGDHPADIWGVALFAAALALLARGRLPAFIALCVLSSAVWEKHAFLFVVAALALWGPLGWRRALAWSALTALASASVQVYYHYHLPVSAPIPPSAHFDWATLRDHLPASLGYHALLAGPGLLAVALSPALRRAPMLRALLPYYPLLVGAYVSQLFYLHEMRSFVVLVPIFAAYLARGIEGPAPGP
jgi:hypothetical protein